MTLSYLATIIVAYWVFVVATFVLRTRLRARSPEARIGRAIRLEGDGIELGGRLDLLRAAAVLVGPPVVLAIGWLVAG